MWLATQHGYYSIVKKAKDEYHIRARVRKDLENLAEIVAITHQIHCWESADYRYRIIVEEVDFLRIMAQFALALDYPNFKSQIARLPGQRDKLNAFHQVWEIMAGIQQEQSESPHPTDEDAPKP